MPTSSLRVVDPADIPVSILETRMHMRFPERTDNDAELIRRIRAGVFQAEARTNRALMAQTWEATFDGFPCGLRYLELPHPPLQSVTWVKYLDSGGAQLTYDSAGYAIDRSTLFGRVRLAAGATWPAVYGGGGSVTVRYVAGYDDIDKVPDDICQWIMSYVESSDKHRGLVSERRLDMTFVDQLLDVHKVYFA